MSKLYSHTLIFVLSLVFPGFVTQPLAKANPASITEKPPYAAYPFPSTPEQVSADCQANIDEILQEQFSSEVNYDPTSLKWWFEGIVTASVHYSVRFAEIDLVKVRFWADGAPRSVWVTVGVQSPDGNYYAWGPWSNAVEAAKVVRVGQASVRVEVSRDLGAYVNGEGTVDFSACDSPLCQFANWSEVSNNNPSYLFITSNGSMAPGWYPWGYLPWRITPKGTGAQCQAGEN